MAKRTVVKVQPKTGPKNGTGPKARAGLCPRQNAINQIATKSNK